MFIEWAIGTDQSEWLALEWRFPVWPSISLLVPGSLRMLLDYMAKRLGHMQGLNSSYFNILTTDKLFCLFFVF